MPVTANPKHFSAKLWHLVGGGIFAFAVLLRGHVNAIALASAGILVSTQPSDKVIGGYDDIIARSGAATGLPLA